MKDNKNIRLDGVGYFKGFGPREAAEYLYDSLDKPPSGIPQLDELEREVFIRGFTCCAELVQEHLQDAIHLIQLSGREN